MKKTSVDTKTIITDLLEISANDYNTAIAEILQETIPNMPETN